MKLVWTQEPIGADDHSHVGRLPAGLPTALFIITPSAGGFALSGAVITDGEDGEEYAGLEQAKFAAQGWLDSWVAAFTRGWKHCEEIAFPGALEATLESVVECGAPLCRAHPLRDVLGLVTIGFEAAWRGLRGETQDPLAVQRVVKKILGKEGD